MTELPDKLLDLIYDAAAEEELWVSALIQIADMTSSVGGLIFGVQNNARRLIFAFNGRLSEEALRAYRERHIANPMTDVMNYSPVGKLVRSDDILPLAALKRTAMFDEVFRPQDVAYIAMVPLAAKHDFQVGFSICRSERQGSYEANELRLCSQLYPHLRRSLLLGFRLDGYRALQRAEFQVLDRLSVGIVLLDHTARAVFVNAAARLMTAYDGPLRLRNSILSAFSQAHSRRLDELILAAMRGMPVGTMSVPHPQDGRLFTILVSSVRSRDIDRFGSLGLRNVTVIFARRLALTMGETWRQPVVVENRPGAGTTLGADMVAKAAPDGHTLLINSAAFATSAAIYSKLPYEPVKDFAPVSQIAVAPIAMVVAPSLGAKSIKDLIELAKRQPGRINFGSSGVGSSTHFAGEQFKLAARLNVTHVPYRGPSEALLDTVTGRIQYAMSPLVPALPFIRDGKLLALGVTTAQRSPALQDVPTVAEAGLPGYEYQDWWGVFAPAATPRAIIEKIGKEIARTLDLPDVTKQVLSQGAEPRSSTPDEFTAFVRAKFEAARQVAALAGIRAE